MDTHDNKTSPSMTLEKSTITRGEYWKIETEFGGTIRQELSLATDGSRYKRGTRWLCSVNGYMPDAPWSAWVRMANLILRADLEMKEHFVKETAYQSKPSGLCRWGYCSNPGVKRDKETWQVFCKDHSEQWEEIFGDDSMEVWTDKDGGDK